MLDWVITLTSLVLLIGLAVLSNWRAGLPWNDLKPRVVPWRLVMLFSVFAIILVLVHLANLAGIETGPEHSPLGRF